jgi:hypothetical protein
MDWKSKDDKSSSSSYSRRDGRDDPRGRRGAVAAVDRSVPRDKSFGYVKLTASDHSSLRVEFVHSDDGVAHDARSTSPGDYKDVLACTVDSCAPTAWLANELHDRRGGHY